MSEDIGGESQTQNNRNLVSVLEIRVNQRAIFKFHTLKPVSQYMDLVGEIGSIIDLLFKWKRAFLKNNAVDYRLNT